MIPRSNILGWQAIAPWPNTQLVEHDLILSRAICELYQHPLIREQLVFRGGTALHKLFFKQAGRFSEDLDFVQKQAEPIGQIVEAIRECLDSWLGKPSWKQNQGRFTLSYRFETETKPISVRKVKIEINTREHFSVLPRIIKGFSVENAWFTGKAPVLTYSLEELLGTKLRALYQRKKGRDLYDLWYVLNYFKEIDKASVAAIFQQYMKSENKVISRAEFEQNLQAKKSDKVFGNDMLPLLTPEQAKLYKIDTAFQQVLNNFVVELTGESWKGKGV